MALIERGGKPYMFRYYLGAWGRCAAFLHHIVASDPDSELHDHPHRWAIGLILAGGYREERLHRYTRHLFGAPVGEDTCRIVRRFWPGRINFVRGTDFHRLTLVSGRDAWTLFIHGPRAKPWGFLRPDGTVRLVTGRVRDSATR